VFDSSLRIAVRCALYTALTLVGGLLIGIAAGTLIFDSLPGHMAEPSRIGLSAIAALIGTFAGGGFWGWLMGRQIGSPSVSRMVWAGALGYGLPVVLLAVSRSMHALGWVVGAPGAAERFTMLTVMFSGNLGVALVAGGISGWLLSRRGTIAMVGDPAVEGSFTNLT
jgi:hypothetical protein